VGLLGAVGDASGAEVIEPLGPAGAALGAGVGVIGAVGGGAVGVSFGPGIEGKRPIGAGVGAEEGELGEPSAIGEVVDCGAALGGAGVGTLGGGCAGVLIVKGR
jgi:hypothetical protein